MTTWQNWSIQRREAFLRSHNFGLGWAAHTWRYLPRNIQTLLE